MKLMTGARGMLAAAAAVLPVSCSYHHAYKKTGSGVVEVKTLPASKAIRSTAGGDYYDHSNGLFRRLFNYIQKNKVAMTVPVEAHHDPGRMTFFVGPADADKDLKSTDPVEVLSLPERTVVSYGGRGAYTRKNFDKGRARLDAWLVDQTDWRAAGPPYAVYWNSPFVLDPFKRFEVHLPIAPKP